MLSSFLSSEYASGGASLVAVATAARAFPLATAGGCGWRPKVKADPAAGHRQLSSGSRMLFGAAKLVSAKAMTSSAAPPAKELSERTAETTCLLSFFNPFALLPCCLCLLLPMSQPLLLQVALRAPAAARPLLHLAAHDPLRRRHHPSCWWPRWRGWQRCWARATRTRRRTKVHAATSFTHYALCKCVPRGERRGRWGVRLSAPKGRRGNRGNGYSI